MKVMSMKKSKLAKELREALEKEKRKNKSMAMRLGRMHQRNTEQREVIESMKAVQS
jgi:hypothetical protein